MKTFHIILLKQYVKKDSVEMTDVRVDDEKLLELIVLRKKESICNVCLGIELNREHKMKLRRL